MTHLQYTVADGCVLSHTSEVPTLVEGRLVVVGVDDDDVDPEGAGEPGAPPVVGGHHQVVLGGGLVVQHPAHHQVEVEHPVRCALRAETERSVRVAGHDLVPLRRVQPKVGVKGAAERVLHVEGGRLEEARRDDATRERRRVVVDVEDVNRHGDVTPGRARLDEEAVETAHLAVHAPLQGEHPLLTEGEDGCSAGALVEGG